MTHDEWRQANDAYLGLALAWLRLRLERAAPADASETTPAVVGAADAPIATEAVLIQRRRWRRATQTPMPAPAPPRERPALAVPSVEAVTQADVDGARAAMDDAAAAMSPPPELVRLAAVFGLSTFERDVLLLCASVEFDTRIPRLCAAVHGSPFPTFALALSLFDDPAWDVRASGRPLRFWHLIEVEESSTQPLTTSRLRADERVVDALKGLDLLDHRLAPFLEPRPGPTGPLPPSQDAVVAATVRRLTESTGERPSLVELVGPDREARDAMAVHIAARVGLPLHRLPLELVPTAPADLDLLARLVHREAVLSALALLIDADDVEERSPAHAALNAFLPRGRVLTFLGGRDVRGDLPVPALLVDVIRPTAAEQADMWRDALGDAAEVDVVRLVAQFDLDADAIRHVAAAPAADDRALTDRLWDGCRRHSRPRLEALAQRLDTRAGWDQLVLPPAEQGLLHAIADQVAQRGRVYEDWGFGERMNRGLGISALFAGESGTGKTMAAEVLANELALDLYRIDLSSVVSKYIGETEKNLRRLFDAAERGGVILFFDEADALFGKRSEVKDAHDRYANIEISYLLQRMEAYRGLAILATNMKGAIDRAFARRLRFVVDFPFPTAADRARMWSRVFPAAAPVTDLDVDRLARLNLTGAGIHNAAVNAAFLAASAGHDIGMRDVLDAARNELRKAERPINEADFRLEEAVRS